MGIHAIAREFVQPFYLEFLHGNFLSLTPPEQAVFVGRVKRAMAKVENRDLEMMFNCGGWREMLAAGWFVGLLRLEDFVDRVGDLLVKSPTCYAGQSFCFAMVRYASVPASKYLRTYLDTYLPVGDREYDQLWAIGTLSWVDTALGTADAATYAGRHQAWEITCRGRPVGAFDPQRGIRLVRAVMTFVEQHFGPFGAARLADGPNPPP